MNIVLPFAYSTESYEVRDAGLILSNPHIVFDGATRILSIYVAEGGVALTKALDYVVVGANSEKTFAFTVMITEYTAQSGPLVQ